jgi:hypothetical protein
MEPIPAGWLSADGSTYHPIVVEQTECVVEPLRTPPLPAESFVLSGAHQVSPNLLLHPELNVGKALARVPHRKVVHPSPQNRIDEFNHSPYGLADVSPEDFLQLPQECRPLLRLGHKMGPPLSVTASDAAILKSQEAKSLSLR